MTEPDPHAAAHRLLDRHAAGAASLAIPPVIFLGSAVVAAAAEELELAALLGGGALLTAAVGAALAWGRLRTIRKVRRILDEAARRDRPGP